MKSLTPFLTAAGFLTAVSLVWGQWWVQLWFQPDKVPELAVLLGLAWTYISVFIPLVAFGWAAGSNLKSQSGDVGTIPLSLLVTAFIMALINVGQSVLSSITRLLWRTSLAEILLEKLPHPVAWTLGMITFILIIMTGCFVIIKFILRRSYKGALTSES